MLYSKNISPNCVRVRSADTWHLWGLFHSSAHDWNFAKPEKNLWLFFRPLLCKRSQPMPKILLKTDSALALLPLLTHHIECWFDFDFKCISSYNGRSHISFSSKFRFKQRIKLEIDLIHGDFGLIGCALSCCGTLCIWLLFKIHTRTLLNSM